MRRMRGMEATITKEVPRIKSSNAPARELTTKIWKKVRWEKEGGVLSLSRSMRARRAARAASSRRCMRASRMRSPIALDGGGGGGKGSGATNALLG